MTRYRGLTNDSVLKLSRNTAQFELLPLFRRFDLLMHQVGHTEISRKLVIDSFVRSQHKLPERVVEARGHLVQGLLHAHRLHPIV